MDINNIIDKYFIKLFIKNFDEIKITEEIKNRYSWKNMYNIFDDLYNNLKKDIKNFKENYYLLILIFMNYTNFLKYINHDDINSVDMFDYIHKIKYNHEFIILFFNDRKNNKKYSEKYSDIIDTFNPFIKSFISNDSLTENDIINFINNSKLLANSYNLKNNESQNNSKRILDIILYKYILSNECNFNNFHNFFIKNIINKSPSYDFNFNIFMNNIPNYKNLIQLNVSEDIDNNLNIKLSDIIDFIIINNPNINKKTINVSEKIKYYELVNIKFGGKLLIKKSINRTNDITIYQQNINLLNFNIKELKKYSFIKKTNNFIVIEYSSSIINNLSNLLHIIHLLTIGLQILASFPSSISEYMFPIDYNKYYYKTFCNFLNYIKKKINIDMSYNRFLIDLIKYYYIYSYYDYYFYYNSKLVNTIINRINFKNNIFDDFCESLKYIFKLPNNMFSYPPFFSIDDDIDNLIYYNLEIPNYFKFCDLINAIINTFNIEIRNFDLMNIFQYIKCNYDFIPQNFTINKQEFNKQDNIKQEFTKQNNIKQEFNKQEFTKQDNIKQENIKQEKLTNNNNNPKNEYIEINIENTENYIFQSER
jgi:hypothetical protein